MTAHCPLCKSTAADVSWQTAPSQMVCMTEWCPVTTWNEDKHSKLHIAEITMYREGGHDA